MKNKDRKNIISYIFLTVILVLFFSIGVRIVTRTVLVSRLGMDNGFTRLVFFDAKSLTNTETVTEKVIAWAKDYPFDEEDLAYEDSEPASETEMSARKNLYSRMSDKISSKVNSMKTKIEDFSTDFLMGYNGFTFLARKYESVIGWNFVSYAEYNGILALEDDYLTTISEKEDVSTEVNNVKGLAEFCKEKGIEFLYVNTPVKICKNDDGEVTSGVDFANENADELLKGLENVSTLDLRNVLHADGLNHHSLFFKTDHHWTQETGLWAAKNILSTLDEACGVTVDTEILCGEYDRVTYEEWFLGSQGKKVTLANATPDDFTVLYPQYDTNLTITVPNVEYEATGSFEITYDYAQLLVKDYNQKSPYAACSYGDKPNVVIKNHLATNNTKILFVRDSFGDVVTSFLSLGVSELHSLDLRYFDGSLKSYIEVFEPDAVVVLYAPTSIIEPNMKSHYSLYDFR